MSLSRRIFIKTIATLPLFVVLSCTRGQKPQESVKPLAKSKHPNIEGLIQEDHPLAKALGYRHEAKAVPTSERQLRLGVAGHQQFCNNCLFYKNAKRVGNQEVAACTLLQNQLVLSQGWCRSWAIKKA